MLKPNFRGDLNLFLISLYRKILKCIIFESLLDTSYLYSDDDDDYYFSIRKK
jgi:hypothetical protein